MESADGKWKLFVQLLEHWKQPEFGDLWCSRDNFPLRYFVDCIDVIDTLGTLAVALMDGVDAQISGAAVRLGLAPLADRDDCGTGWMIAGVAFAISLGVAEPVELRHREPRQTFVDSLVILAVFAFQYPFCCRTAEIPVSLVHVRQQLDIGFAVTSCELPALIRRRLDTAAGGEACNQPSDLGPTEARHTGHIAANQPFFPSAQCGVLVADQRLLGPPLNLVSPLACESDFATGFQKHPDLFQARRFRIVHADDQSPASRFCPSGSSCMRIQSQFQAHLV